MPAPPAVMIAIFIAKRSDATEQLQKERDRRDCPLNQAEPTIHGDVFRIRVRDVCSERNETRRTGKARFLHRHKGKTDRIIRSTSRPGRQHRMSVLPNLFGRFEQHLVSGIVIVFAVVRGVFTADLRSSFISPAEVVRLQVLAVCVHHDVPAAFVDKNADRAMHHVPPNVVKIIPCLRSFEGQCKITTAFAGAILTQDLSGLEIFSFDFDVHDLSQILMGGIPARCPDRNVSRTGQTLCGRQYRKKLLTSSPWKIVFEQMKCVLVPRRITASMELTANNS